MKLSAALVVVVSSLANPCGAFAPARYGSTDGRLLMAATADILSSRKQNWEQWNQEELQEMTEQFMNHDVGSLSSDLLEDSFQLLNSWSRTACPTGATQAENILTRLEAESRAGNEHVSLSTMHYAAVINAWAKSDHFQCGLHAQCVLDRLDEATRSNPEVHANRVALNAAIHAWSKQGSIEEAEAIFTRMRQDPTIELEMCDFNAILGAYARQGDPKKAEQLLDDMLSTSFEPDLSSYNFLLEAWARSEAADAAEKAEAILRTMEESFDKGDSTIRPNPKSYSNVAHAYSRICQSEDAIRKAEQLLKEADKRGVATEDTHLFNAVLGTWADSPRDDAAKVAETMLFSQMEPSGNVNSVSYNTVIKAWLHSKVPDAAQKAEGILHRMEYLQSSDSELDISPDAFTFTTVIDCYAKSNQPGVASKAVNLFDRMVTSYKNGNILAKPTTVTINCVLDALAKSGEKGAAEEAEELLLRMRSSGDPCYDKVNLDTISYTSVIHAYAKSGTSDAAQKAQEIFDLMKSDYEKGNQFVKPNTKTYNSVMNAWVQSGTKGSAERAEAVLKKLEEESSESGVQPDVVSYSIVMNGWSKSNNRDCVAKAKAIFDRMVAAYHAGNEGARPNVHSYTALITAVIRAGGDDAPAKAEGILRIMYKEYEGGNTSVKPTTLIMTTVIDAWAKSGHRDAGTRAECLLNWMLELYETTSDSSFQPNEVSFSAAMNAWAKSRDFRKSQKAKAILDRMVKMYENGQINAKPNTLVFTTLINACAYTQGDQSVKVEAFNIATEAFKQLYQSKYGPPNHITYNTYMTACRNLLPEGEARIQSIEAILRRCCQDGQLDKLVVQRAERTMSPERLQAFFGDSIAHDNTVNLASLPREWTRNVRRKPSKHHQPTNKRP